MKIFKDPEGTKIGGLYFALLCWMIYFFTGTFFFTDYFRQEGVLWDFFVGVTIASIFSPLIRNFVFNFFNLEISESKSNQYYKAFGQFLILVVALLFTLFMFSPQILLVWLLISFGE